MSGVTKELEQVCTEFAGGMAASGTECVVSVKSSGTTMHIIEVVSGTPTGDPRELVQRVSEVSKIPIEDVEIFVYVICGGARGREI